MSSIGKITLGRDAADENLQIYYALSASADETITGASDGVNVDVGSCQPADHATLWDYNDNLVSRIPKPDDCFRLTVDMGLERNYLDAYTVEFDPKGADVSWGMIPWWAKDEDLMCPVRTWSAMEQVDVCAMFEDEVARLPTPTAVAVVQQFDSTVGGTATDNLTGNSLAGFQLNFKDAADSRHRFTAMWYLDDTTAAKKDVHDLYANHNLTDADPPALDETARGTTSGSLIGSTLNRTVGADGGVWVPTLDDDFDPMYGDLGKVSTDGNDNADNFADDDDSYKCSGDDGGSAATGDDGEDNNSTLCDAADVEIMTSVTYPLGLGYGCDAVTVDYTLTCQWSSRGNRKNTVGGINTDGIDADGSDIGDFVSCKVE